MTGNLKIISDSRIRYIVSKGPKYRFPSRIDFKKCREEIAFSKYWINVLNSQNTNLLPPKPKSTFRHLKQGIQDFHRKYVLVPADKAANNVVVV